jgi:hypothetical protein
MAGLAAFLTESGKKSSRHTGFYVLSNAGLNLYLMSYDTDTAQFSPQDCASLASL